MEIRIGHETDRQIKLIDRHPPATDLMAEVHQGLTGRPKTLPCKLLYDESGSQLFDRICELEEYYPTRTEIGILRGNLAQIAERVGPDCLVIEYGSGSGVKTRLLLEHLQDCVGYVPIDISRDALLGSVHDLAGRFPALPIHPVCADYTAPLQLPAIKARRRLVFFPGSTIGNFRPDDAVRFMHAMRQTAGPNAGLLIGADLRKDRRILEAAYNDREGVTAAFNLNVLTRINRELDGTFDAARFEHRAVFNEVESRIEMHLVSREPQIVRVGTRSFSFAAGESIRTELSHKFTRDHFARLAAKAGWRTQCVWTDTQQYFSVQYLEPDPKA